MANNPVLFNAALSGVFGGVSTARALVSAVGSSYSSQLADATAFATALDAQIVAGTYTASDGALLQAIVQQVVSGRGTAGLNSIMIAAIVAAFDAANGALVTVPPAVANDTFSFREDFDVFPNATVTTAGLTAPAGETNWWCQAISGSGNQSISTNPSPQNSPNHPGIARFLTSATINNGLGFRRGQLVSSSSQICRADKIARVTTWFAVPVVTNIRMQIGVDGEPVTAAISEGAMLILDTSVSPFFQIAASRNGSQTNAITSVQPVASSFNTPTFWKLDLEQESSGIWNFFLNDVQVGQINKSGATPTTATNFGGMVQNLAAAAVELQVDLFEVESVPLNRFIS